MGFSESRPLKNVNFCSSSRQMKNLTAPVRSPRPTGQAGIYGIFRGLNFDNDADLPAKALAQAGVGQKGVFFKGLESPHGEIE
jgi:hypothetical protein